MRPLRNISPFLVLLVIPLLTSVGEDAQVIRSPKSVLTIYSYGYGAALRVAPEIPERNRRTAALSDVVAAPPLSSSVLLWPRNPGVDARREMVAPTTATAPNTANTIPGNTSGQTTLTIIPIAPRSEEHTSELQSLRHLVCRL